MGHISLRISIAGMSTSLEVQSAAYTYTRARAAKARIDFNIAQASAHDADLSRIGGTGRGGGLDFKGESRAEPTPGTDR